MYFLHTVQYRLFGRRGQRMACSSGTCQSGCYGDNAGEEEGHNERPPQPVTGNSTHSSNGHAPGGNPADRVCLKCKVNQTIAASAVTVANGGGDSGGYSGGDSGRFCYECFRSNLYGKFRFAVTSNAMISPSDNVLVAFSGGPASRVVLQFVHEMQERAQKNFDASRDRSLPVFGVGVAFIDESSNYSLPSDEFKKAIEDMKDIVSNLAPPVKQFHVAPTESIYLLDSGDGSDKLRKLLDAVTDVTGKEDLMDHLRMLSLQKIAVDNGYTKLLLGTCTSRIACQVLEATVKGQGYSLAADIQYVDARWEIPVVLPLRDCLQQELNLLCSLDSLKTVDAFRGLCSGINGLITSFVKLLQEENPSRESTIVRTAGKLTPFHFNRIPEDDDSASILASRRWQKKYNLKLNESLPPESFCPICNSPLKKSDTESFGSIKNGQTNTEGFKTACCSSCQFQILPKEPTSLEKFYPLLPQPVITRGKHSSYDNHKWLREQIQDCLLSDTEDGA